METEVKKDVEDVKENKKVIEPDFPFYNDNPPITWVGILLLLIGPIAFTILAFSPIGLPFGLGPYALSIGPLILFAIVAKGKLSLLIKKPKIRDFIRVIVTLILQYIFVIAVGIILKFVLNLEMNGNPVLDLDMDVSFWISVIFQLFGEELYKIMIFLVVLTIMNRLTKKRTLSIVVATTFTLFCFAMVHFTTYGKVVQILLCQGVASIFCMYNYLKSKNILTSYAQHFLLDAIPFILAMIHVI